MPGSRWRPISPIRIAPGPGRTSRRFRRVPGHGLGRPTSSTRGSDSTASTRRTATTSSAVRPDRRRSTWAAEPSSGFLPLRPQRTRQTERPARGADPRVCARRSSTPFSAAELRGRNGRRRGAQIFSPCSGGEGGGHGRRKATAGPARGGGRSNGSRGWTHGKSEVRAVVASPIPEDFASRLCSVCTGASGRPRPRTSSSTSSRRSSPAARGRLDAERDCGATRSRSLEGVIPPPISQLCADDGPHFRAPSSLRADGGPRAPAARTSSTPRGTRWNATAVDAEARLSAARAGAVRRLEASSRPGTFCRCRRSSRRRARGRDAPATDLRRRSA